MIAGARRIPVQHLSVRVPWHDAGWVGTVCDKPASNTACRALRRIAETKAYASETAAAGRSLGELSPDQSGAVHRRARELHGTVPDYHVEAVSLWRAQRGLAGHFEPTALTMPAYGAAYVPFRWMLKKEGVEVVERYNLGLQPDREPNLGFDPRLQYLHRRPHEALLLDYCEPANATDGIEVELLGRESPKTSNLRMGTMHRVKGLEFPVVFVAGVQEEFVPLPTDELRSTDAVVAQQAEKRERCLLYVSSSRARDRRYVTGHGARSPFLSG